MHHGQLLILGQEETTAAVRVSVEVGSTQSLIHTVSGRLLLSMLSVDERDAILASDTDWKKLKPRQQRDLKGHLELIRDRGYEDAKSAFIEGVFDLSVPIRASNSALHAALTITVLSWRNRPSGEDATKQLLPALIESAAEIQRVAGLGFRLP
jgi:DNA-binding IclR family transcriptional regulator